MARPKRITKHPSYTAAVQWIADNDNPATEEEIEVLGGYLTVALVADLFGAEPEAVARDVIRQRRKSAA